MICPQCKTMLSPTGIAEGLIWKCEACSGAAANIAVLRKYLKDGTVSKLWRAAVAESTQSDKRCPSCGHALREFAAGRDSRRISLDLCRTCQLMWFDRNELEAFPRAEKLPSSDMNENLAIARIGLEAQLENEQSPAENIIATCIDIIFLIIRILL